MSDDERRNYMRENELRVEKLENELFELRQGITNIRNILITIIIYVLGFITAMLMFA